MSLKVGRMLLGEVRWQPGSLQLCRGQDQSKMLVARALTLPSWNGSAVLPKHTEESKIMDLGWASKSVTKDCLGFRSIEQGSNCFLHLIMWCQNELEKMGSKAQKIGRFR